MRTALIILQSAGLATQLLFVVRMVIAGKKGDNGAALKCFIASQTCMLFVLICACFNAGLK
jgi:hypothetical protein